MLLPAAIAGRLALPLLYRRLIVPTVISVIIVVLARPAAAATVINLTLPEVPGVHATLRANLFVHRVTPCTAVLLTKFTNQVRNSSVVGQRRFILLVIGHEDLLVLLHVDAISWAGVFHAKHAASSGAICEHVTFFGFLGFSWSGVPVASMAAG